MNNGEFSLRDKTVKAEAEPPHSKIGAPHLGKTGPTKARKPKSTGRSARATGLGKKIR